MTRFSCPLRDENMVSCKECTKYKNCDLYSNLWRAREKLMHAKKRNLRLDETVEEYLAELEKMKQEYRELRKKQLKCLNKREYLHRKLGYNTFRKAQK